MHSVKKILEHIEMYSANDPDIQVVWLYGSQAKGTAHESSDIDVAIAFQNFSLTDMERKLRPEEYALIWAAELNLPDAKLSVVDINSIPTYLAFNVVEYGRVLLSKDKPREYKETQRIYSQFEFEMIESRASKMAQV